MFAITPAVGVDAMSDSTTIARIRGFNNPGFAPMMLSWHLGGGLFAKLGAAVWAPIGTIAAGPFNNGLGNVGAPYWTFDQHLAISYLAHDLNLTANFIHAINSRNTYSGVTNGNSLNVDFTATKKFQKFEIGPVGYIGTQVTSDSGCEAFYGPASARGARRASMVICQLFGVARDWPLPFVMECQRRLAGVEHGDRPAVGAERGSPRR